MVCLAKSGGFNPFTHGVDGERVKSDVVRFNIRTARNRCETLVEDGAIQAKTDHKNVKTKTSNNSGSVSSSRRVECFEP